MHENLNTDAISRRKSQGVRVAIVSAVFVVLGIALREQVPWYVTAFFAGCLLVGVLETLGVRWQDRPPTDRLTIDGSGITRTAPGLREHVAWSDITRVRIMTTDQGPRFEDVFFVLDSKAGGGCVVPHDLAVRGGLLEALQSRLEGVDNAAVIQAMGSSDNRVVTIWEEKSRT